MDAHSDCCPASRQLCEALYLGLSQRVKDVDRANSQRWCCFFKSGKARFAYLNHRKSMGRIEVWFAGQVADEALYPGLRIVPRQVTSGGFGAAFAARFFIDSQAQVAEAVNLLTEIADEAN